MPEGDTIFRAARHLRRALVGRPVTRFSLPGRPGGAEPMIGAVPVDVESRGKNLLVWFSNDRVLYSHMKMTGSWHLYRPGERWRKSPRAVKARIDNDAFVAVCFSAPVVELMTGARARRHPVLAALGPDLLAVRPDFDEMLRRLRSRSGTPLGEALLDQRALAGIGNVYKSELCYLRRLDPFASVGSVSDPELRALLVDARRRMLENLDTFRRTTRRDLDGERYWVYGRAGAGCHACGTSIRLRRQGDQGRSTYFCPRCQGIDRSRSRRPPGEAPEAGASARVDPRPPLAREWEP